MAGNLSARLKRIREASKAGPCEIVRPVQNIQSQVLPDTSFVKKTSLFPAGWDSVAPLVLKRSHASSIGAPLPEYLDTDFAILCPSVSGLFEKNKGVASTKILFFDLETTGLSGGAGTVAFLAAFGRFIAEQSILSIDQYLLLDYPGEIDLINLISSEINRGKDAPVLCSYNGRSFDVQILKNRFLMNGMKFPHLPHLDLVHPARRLWRKKLPSCSLVDVERGILGIHRDGDLPGSEAPTAWFDFLKTGQNDHLLAICDHNNKDLEGLAALLLKMDSIVKDPLQAAITGDADVEGLASRWISAVKALRCKDVGAQEQIENTARTLLEKAVTAGSVWATLVLASELVSERDFEKAVNLRSRIAVEHDEAIPARSRAIACRLLAIDAEHRLRDHNQALAWTELGLKFDGLGVSLCRDFERRKARLVGKVSGQ